MDGVLRHFDEQAEVERRYGITPGTIAATAFSEDLLRPAITGAVRDEQWRAAVASALAPRLGAGTARDAVAAWTASPGRIDAEVLALLRTTRKAAPVIVLTNATTRLPHDLHRLGLTEEFDAIVSSAATGHPKPHAAAFNAALDAAQAKMGQVLAPAEVLFVDDDRRHVEAAGALGWRTHLFSGSSRLAATLRRAGLLV